MNEILRVALVQTDIVWEDKEQNLLHCAAVLEGLSGRCDLAVLPEMFTTGFSMRAEELSEPVSGPTVEALMGWARRYNLALAGSFMAREGEVCYNRGFMLITMTSATSSAWGRRGVILQLATGVSW